MLLTKVTSAMKTRAQLDERSFEQLLAAAYMLQQQREDIDAVLAEIAVLERDCRRRLKPDDTPRPLPGGSMLTIPSVRKSGP